MFIQTKSSWCSKWKPQPNDANDSLTKTNNGHEEGGKQGGGGREDGGERRVLEQRMKERRTDGRMRKEAGGRKTKVEGKD